MAFKLAEAFIQITTRSRVAQDLSQQKQDATKQIGSLGALAGTLGGAFAGIGLGILARQVVGLASSAEQTRVAFNVILKDVEKTETLLKELEDFSLVTPFTPSEVRAAGQQLLAFRFAAEDIPSILQMLGDAAAGANQRLLDIVPILTKIKSEGKGTGETLQQFGERGINVMAELQDMLGKSEEEMRKMRERGEISFDLVVRAMRRMTGESGMFFQAMEKQSTTLGGRWSTLVGAVVNLGEKLGGVLVPSLTKAAELATKLADAAAILDRMTGGVASQFVLMATAVGVAGKFLGKIDFAKLARSVLLLARGPLIWVTVISTAITSVVALARKVAAMTKVQEAWGRATAKLQAAWDVLGPRLRRIYDSIAAAVGSVVGRLKEWLGIGDISDVFAGFVDWIGDAAVEFVAFTETLISNWRLAWDIMTDAATVAMMSVGDLISDLLFKALDPTEPFRAMWDAVHGKLPTIELSDETQRAISTMNAKWERFGEQQRAAAEAIRREAQKRAGEREQERRAAAESAAAAAAERRGEGAMFGIAEVSQKLQELFLKPAGDADARIASATELSADLQRQQLEVSKRIAQNTVPMAEAVL